MTLHKIGLACLAAAGLAAAAGSAGGYASDHGAYFAPTLRYEGVQGSVDVTFGIEEAARVSLVAFDAQGKQLAVLFDAEQGAGYHHLSLFSNRLQTGDGKVLFQLRAGNAVLAEARR
jgi:hypothetical protein